VGRAENTELGGKRKDRIGAKMLKKETGRKRRGRRLEIYLVSRDIGLKSREGNGFMEGSLRITAFNPGASPPPVRTAIRFMLTSAVIIAEAEGESTGAPLQLGFQYVPLWGPRF
jgi:hypothetical protein